MKSISATEIAKMGKCEKLIASSNVKMSWRDKRLDKEKNAAEKSRGDAAHKRYENEASSYSWAEVRKLDGQILKLTIMFVVVSVATLLAVL